MSERTGRVRVRPKKALYAEFSESEEEDDPCAGFDSGEDYFPSGHESSDGERRTKSKKLKTGESLLKATLKKEPLDSSTAEKDPLMIEDDSTNSSIPSTESQTSNKAEPESTNKASTISPSTKVYQCPSCPIAFTSAAFLERHRCRQPVKKPVTVSKGLNSDKRYSGGIKNNKILYPCSRCPHTFSSQELLDKHKCSKSLNPEPDDTVNQIADSERTLAMKAKLFKCPTCDIVFTSAEFLGKHRCRAAEKKLMMEKPIVFTCEKCTLTFSSPEFLERHKCHKRY